MYRRKRNTKHKRKPYLRQLYKKHECLILGILAMLVWLIGTLAGWMDEIR